MSGKGQILFLLLGQWILWYLLPWHSLKKCHHRSGDSQQQKNFCQFKYKTSFYMGCQLLSAGNLREDFPWPVNFNLRCALSYQQIVISRWSPWNGYQQHKFSVLVNSQNSSFLLSGPSNSLEPMNIRYLQVNCCSESHPRVWILHLQHGFQQILARKAACGSDTETSNRFHFRGQHNHFFFFISCLVLFNIFFLFIKK